MNRYLGKIKALLGITSLNSNLLFITKCFDLRLNESKHYQLALIHRSSPGAENNERLELLGDAVLDLIVADYLFHNFPELNEGELTKLKAKLISREQLNQIGHEIGLVENLNLEKQKDLDPSLLIGNVLEAIFGAVYLDQGYQKTKQVAVKMFEQTCDIRTLSENLHDAKSLLLEWSQKARKNIRIKIHPEENENFRAKIYIGETLIAQGEGRSKKRAEKNAARKALKVIDIER
ncbi:MAG: ribonuclease III [Flavobacteriales bacterium]|nr:ribonuclease III [Flavobacteriales bacterium]NNK80913.1 ribonuclease III [Flavobacteriales bacterium]